MFNFARPGDVMKINAHFFKQLIVVVLSLTGIYVVTLGDFILSSALLCTAFIVSNLGFSNSLRS
ncbi:MAG: hypothetical protein CTY17_05815 [Methylomonas sp.]|nr:MAG: hypothetical protein CTY17_05815 [Methylomonas sp.]PPD54841.1 MAG: hypothetical protein CTY11_02830 [Methylomonas sp.]